MAFRSSLWNFLVAEQFLPGDVLVSNFNNSMNLQGTGTTIIRFRPHGTIAPSGSATVFFQSTLAGLTTVLGVLKRGFVLVGNVPTTDGTVGTISNGVLQVLDSNGNLLDTLINSTFLDSPWDLTIDDEGDFAHVSVSNVLSGTVSRIDLTVGSANITVLNKTQIATGYGHQPNVAALVPGPTGLAYDRRTDVLYVASTDDNEILRFQTPGARQAQPLKARSSSRLRTCGDHWRSYSHRMDTCLRSTAMPSMQIRHIQARSSNLQKAVNS
jgi:DNA-binding beta-propeller fold protein YncE